MIDVKKFVVAFLVLAAFASSSALIFSGPLPASQPKSGEADLTFSSGARGNGNAFAPAAGTSQGDYAAAALASDDTENNLTNSLAESLADNIFVMNPNGPRTDASGNQLISVPGATDLVAEISASPAYGDIKIPDWDLEAARLTVRIAEDSSGKVAASYNEALEAILDDRFVKTGLQSALQNISAATPDSASRASKEITAALSNVTALLAPEDLSDFHKDFIKILVYERNTLDLLKDAQVDPLKTALIFEKKSGDYDAAVAELQNSFGDALKTGTLSFGHTPERSDNLAGLFTNIFGVHKAHAFIVHDPVNFAQKIKEWVSSILLQVLKNLLVTQLQNRVLRFIQGNGSPMFIQNWAGLVSNAFDVAAGSVIGQIEPGLCDNFSTDVGQWLRNTFSSARITSGGVSLNGAPGTNCTLQDSVNNIPGFYNDFSVGGWEGFISLLAPNNNPFGSFAGAYNQVLVTGEAAADAAKNKAVASQGFKGQERCGDGSNPSSGAGCADGSSPITTTPGSSIGELFSKNGLGSTVELIVNANDLIGLVTTVTTSLVQQLTNTLVSSLSGGGGNSSGGGLTGISPSPTPPAPPPQALTCAPAQMVASSTETLLFSASGGGDIDYTWSAPSGEPSVGTGLAFNSRFNTIGSHTVTVTNPRSNTNTSASCAVTVN